MGNAGQKNSTQSEGKRPTKPQVPPLETTALLKTSNTGYRQLMMISNFMLFTVGFLLATFVLNNDTNLTKLVFNQHEVMKKRPVSALVPLWTPIEDDLVRRIIWPGIIAMFTLALLTMTSGFLGLAILHSKQPILQYYYSVFYICLTVELILIVYVSASIFHGDTKYHQFARNKLQTILITYYKLVSEGMLTVFFNVVMVTGNCCGVDGIEDFQSINLTLVMKGRSKIYQLYHGEDLYWPEEDIHEQLKVPPACCKDLVFSNPETYHRFQEVLRCAKTTDLSTQNHEGCFAKLISKYTWKRIIIFGPVALVVFLLELIVLYKTSLRIVYMAHGLHTTDEAIMQLHVSEDDEESDDEEDDTDDDEDDTDDDDSV